MKMNVISPQVRVGRHNGDRYRVVVYSTSGVIRAFVELFDEDNRLYWHPIKNDNGIGTAVFAVLANPEESKS